jgi:transposase
MRPTGTKHELEIRRRTAVALRDQGLSMRQVADKVGCVPSSVVRWTQALKKHGKQGLDSKPQAGGKSRMTATQKRRLGEYLAKGPRAFGWHNELWTLSRVKQLIESRFGIRYHISNVHRILVQMGLSAQRPARLARERDDAAVERFRRQRWPAIKKSPA